MNDFEQKILNMKSDSHPNLDSDQFLKKLHGRIEQSHENRRTLFTAFMMVFMISILSYIQFDAPIETELYYADETENYFETDFWTVNSDSLEMEDSYSEDLAYFLLDEGDFWDTMDLLNELTNEEEITL